MTTKIVRFFCFKHGKKDGDKLTPEGITQLKTQAEHRLARIPFVVAYHSGTNRTRQTVEILLATINHRGIEIEKELGFGFAWLTGDKNSKDYPDLRFEDHLLEKVDRKELRTVNDCLRLWPPSWAYIGSVRQILLSKAIPWAFGFEDTPGPVNVLVGSHGPTIEMPAALFDRSFPCLKEADMVVYEVEVSRISKHYEIPTHSELVSARYFPCIT